MSSVVYQCRKCARDWERLEEGRKPPPEKMQWCPDCRLQKIREIEEQIFQLQAEKQSLLVEPGEHYLTPALQAIVDRHRRLEKIL
jgi:hypothetical protein